MPGNHKQAVIGIVLLSVVAAVAYDRFVGPNIGAPTPLEAEAVAAIARNVSQHTVAEWAKQSQPRVGEQRAWTSTRAFVTRAADGKLAISGYSPGWGATVIDPIAGTVRRIGASGHYRANVRYTYECAMFEIDVTKAPARLAGQKTTQEFCWPVAL